MRIPNPKEIPEYMPKFVPFSIQLGLAQLYDGNTYTDSGDKCPYCNSTHIRKIGFKEKSYARLITDSGFMDVNVRLQRYLCMNCRKSWQAQGPFYPGTINGSSIVDLVLALSMNGSSYYVENTLAAMGIQIGSDAILKYIRTFADRARERAPLIKGGLYGINTLQLLFGVKNAKELSERLGGKGLESCTDETYPRVKGAVKRLMEEVKVNPELKRYGGNAVDSDGKVRFPDSFTLALSYLPGVEAYSSLLVTKMPFNEVLAEILARALEGTSFNVTDGSKSYSGMKNHVLDPVHKTRVELRHDERFRDMVNKAKDLKKVEGGALTPSQKQEAHERRMKALDELKGYAEKKYQEILEDTLKPLRESHPDYFSGDTFNGHITSNSMEGGNWRLKYLIRLPFIRTDTMAGKSILAAIRDSVYTMRRGKPRTSLANRIGFFSFAMVMG